MLSAADLTMMQGVMGATQITNCTILRNTKSSDGLGGTTDSWATIATTTCRIGLAGGQVTEVVNLGRVESINRYNIGLPMLTDITIRDRIQLTDGSLFEVASVQTPRTYYAEVLVQAEMVVSQ